MPTRSSFSSWGASLLSEAFRKYGLDRLIAGTMMRSRRFGRSPGRLVAGFEVASAGVSTCLSNTATAALMTPIAAGAVRQTGEEVGAARATPWVSGVLLMVAYGASAGGMATLIGTPPNLLAAGFLERLAGVKITFAGWLAFGVPTALVLLALATFWIRLALGSPPAGVWLSPPAGLTPVETHEGTSGRRWTILAFALAGCLWILPGIASVLIGPDADSVKELTTLLPESAVALLCASLLFVAPVN